MTGEDELLYEVDQGVATIVLNRPERLNAWTLRMQELYARALKDADSDPGVRAVVVTGSGKAYSAGADFSRVAERLDPATRGGESGPRYLRTLLVRKPVIAAVNGACAGIALLQACACDVRFASTEAVFIAAFPRRGLIAEEAISWLLPRIVGLSNALDILLSGRRIEAQEARQMGLVNRVVEGEVRAAATAYARELASSCSPTSMAVIKREVYRHAATSIGVALGESRVVKNRSFDLPDPREGFASFKERRNPEFPPLGSLADELGLDLPPDADR